MNTVEQQAEGLRNDVRKLREEVQRHVVGQDRIIDGLVTSMLAGSHALIEGVPGLGKTLLVRSMASAMTLSFSRIQFTPDMMPADILGSTVLSQDERGKTALDFREGPIFANIVLADEVNRATPKTQSALLEAMQEHRVTIAKTTRVLPAPFFVLATQNPIESEGTYPLPEAQLDRFFFKLIVPFPSSADLATILTRTTGGEGSAIKPVLTGERLLTLQQLIRDVPAAPHVVQAVVALVESTHPSSPSATESVRKYVKFGASPRGGQALLLAAKIRAVLEGRYAASVDDVVAWAPEALRHRVLLNFEGEADGVAVDSLIAELVTLVKRTA